ncbi:hypothetical protein AALP_AA8G438600 [Arabis alpina]|uniref:TF-B3 domain-containing protein n=1 Tax=Arabis alpina TaxID=50452 RepID=A0A087GDA8_ARAAL|nr:hypothetical protein AALP_AA8G438600 [Arabis alpina]
MATTLFSSPANPNFFKPLLPGFKTHITIPEAFYSKYLEGKEEGNAATLISDASDITWKVTVDGLRLTHGWEKFALAHDLRVGDILAFRHDGNLMFHVTPFGPGSCEILYSHDNDQNHAGELAGSSKAKKQNPIEDETCIVVVPVTASNLRTDSNLSKGFTTSSGLSKLCNEIILVGETGRSSTIGLVYHNSSNRFCFRGGWRAFCRTNGHKAGGFLRFTLVSNGKTPVLRIFPLERTVDSTRDHVSAEVKSLEPAKEKKNVESLSLSDDSSFVVSVTVNNLKEDKLFLPSRVSRPNIKNKGLQKIDLMNKQGRTWTLTLKNRRLSDRFFITHGWTSFCEENGQKAGCSFTFKLVRHGTNLVLLMNETLREEGV